MVRRETRHALLGATALAIATPAAAQVDTPAAAQETPAEADTQEVVVTAQRQSQRLQDVPIAVSAFTAQAIERQQIDTTEDLQLYLPSITYTRTNFAGGSFTVRGVGDLAIGATNDGSIGIHINEVPIVASRFAADSEYYDLERIEVLRGPQGTLFGRNATGGVVDYITARPTTSFSGRIDGEYANFDSYKVQGHLNVPIADWAGVRVAGYYLSRDGFTRNLLDGGRVDGRDSYSIRGTLRLRPGPDTVIDIVGSRFKESSSRSKIQKQLCHGDPTGVLGCQPDRVGFDTINANATLAGTATSQEFLRIATGNPALGALGLSSVYGPDIFSSASNPADFRQVAIDFAPRYRSDDVFVMARVEHDFGPVKLTVNGSYQRADRRALTDYNLTAADLLASNPTAAAGVAAFRGNPLFDPAERLLFSGPNIGVSATDRSYAGYIGGRIERFAPRTTEYDDDRGRFRGGSVEAHLDSQFDGPFNFLIGGIHLRSRVQSDYFIAASGLDYASAVLGALNGFQATGNPTFGLATPFYNNETTRYRLDTWAGFGEAYLNLTDDLKVTAGLRYTSDRKRLSDRVTPLLQGGIVPLGSAGFDGFPVRSNEVRFRRLTGRAVVDWTPQTSFSDQTLVYASYARGYKAGGINPPFDPRLFAAQANFRPETINAFEVGTKNTFQGGAFRANLTAFYYDYKDLQIGRTINRASFNDNVDARVYGIEGEFLMAPTRRLLFNVNASYLKTRIKDFATVDPRDPSAGRSDTVILKDITNAANCVVAPSAPGVPRADALVTAFNQSIGLRGTTPVPGTSTTGAYSVCAALGQFIAANGLPYDISAPVDVLRTPAGAGFVPITNPAALANIGLPSGIATDVDGNQLPNSPRWKVSVGGQYTLGLPRGLTLVGRVDYALTGDHYARIFNRPIDRIRSYDVINLQLTLNGPGDRWYVRGFVQNLENDDSVTGLYVTDPASALFTNAFTLDPRRYGLVVGVKF